MKKVRGFTLIELLVIIGIIGILAVIIITNINSVKNKARDASIKEAMGTTLTNLSVEYYINHPGNFAGFCEDSVTRDFFSKINSPNDPKCHADANRWVVCVQLYSLNTKAWCTDNTGVKKEINSVLCPPSLLSCQ